MLINLRDCISQANQKKIDFLVYQTRSLNVTKSFDIAIRISVQLKDDLYQLRTNSSIILLYRIETKIVWKEEFDEGPKRLRKFNSQWNRLIKIYNFKIA